MVWKYNKIINDTWVRAWQNQQNDLCTQLRLRSVSLQVESKDSDVQTDLSLCWTYGSFCWICRVAAHSFMDAHSWKYGAKKKLPYTFLQRPTIVAEKPTKRCSRQILQASVGKDYWSYFSVGSFWNNLLLQTSTRGTHYTQKTVYLAHSRTVPQGCRFWSRKCMYNI